MLRWSTEYRHNSTVFHIQGSRLDHLWLPFSVSQARHQAARLFTLRREWMRWQSALVRGGQRLPTRQRGWLPVATKSLKTEQQFLEPINSRLLASCLSMAR